MDKPHSLIKKLESETDSVLRTIQDLVELESPTTAKSACNRLADYLENRFEALGCKTLRITNQEFGDHLKASFNEGSCGDTQSLLMIGHMDTVWPLGEIEKRPFRVEDNCAYGPAIYDMKGGIALALHSLEYMKRNGLAPKLPVQMIWNSDEEVGSPTSRELIESEARHAKYVLVFEPGDLPQGAVNTFRKGVITFSVRVRGKAAHAGANHDTGRNAICELARLVLDLESMTDYEIGTTVNVGTIEGGSRVNVVPDTAEAKVDVRVSNAAENRRMLDIIDSLSTTRKGFQISAQVLQNRPPLERHDQVIALFQQASRIAQELGIPLPESPSGGASDGNFTAAMGKGTLCGIGVVGTGAHAVDEHIVIDWIPRRLALIIRMLERLE